MTDENSVQRSRPGPGRLSAEAAAELPDRLLDAALALFTEQGFSDTSMEQIAKAAGASTKTLYKRHANKTEILEAVVGRMVDQVLAGHDSQAPSAREVEPRRFLISLLGGIAIRVAEDGSGLNRIALAEGHRVPVIKKSYKRIVAQGAERIQRALEQWQADGRLPLLEDPARAGELLLAMTVDPIRIMAAFGEPPGRKVVEARVAYAVDVFLRGCGYDAGAV